MTSSTRGQDGRDQRAEAGGRVPVARSALDLALASTGDVELDRALSGLLATLENGLAALDDAATELRLGIAGAGQFGRTLDRR